MIKKFSSLLLALLISLQTIAIVPQTGYATQAVQENVIVLDEKTASRDAQIHRTDQIEKSGVELSSVDKPEVRAYENNNKPNRIVSTFKNDTRTSRAFNWFTTDKLESYVWVSEKSDMSNAKAYPADAEKVVSHYVERDKDGYFIFQLIDKTNNSVKKYFTDEGKVGGEWDHTYEITDSDNETIGIDVTKIEEYSYKAEAKGLKPETRYYYQVGSESEGRSEIGTFITSAVSQKPFTFLHYTDTQNAYWNQNLIDEAGYGADTLKRALETAPNAEFVIHTGDIVEIAEVEDEWVDLFEQSKESLLGTTIAPVAGNHDEYALNRNERFTHKFNEHFNVPAEGPIDGGSYYSYDYNGVHFVILNTNDNKNEAKKAIGQEQLEWMKKDIKEARENGAQWIILNYHKPIFSKSYHSLQDSDVQAVKEEFMKLIDELDVDLALQGHDHVMSRTKSLSFVPSTQSVFNGVVADIPTEVNGLETLTDPKGTTFVLPNTGGTKAYDDIYSKGLEHINKVRPRLDWLTEELVSEYNGLFAYGEQPQKSERFEKSHSNFRDSTVQNFAKYSVDGNKLTTELYQIEGKLGEERKIKLVDSFAIINNDVDTNVKKIAPTTVYSGSNRYETSVDVSRNFYDNSEAVILASGQIFADSLAASSLSKLYKAPILLTQKSEVPAVVKAEIERLGAKKAIIVGGENSISNDVKTALKGLDVERISGVNRYETASAIAKIVLESSKSKNAIIVSGNDEKFADALSAGSPAFKEDAPILFTSASDLNNATERVLTEVNIENVFIIGGENSVNKKAEDELKTKVKNVMRISGQNRYQTALAVARKFAPDSDEIIITSGQVFADALVASGVLNSRFSPIILTDKNNTNAEVNAYIRMNNVLRITVVGGTNSVSIIK